LGYVIIVVREGLFSAGVASRAAEGSFDQSRAGGPTAVAAASFAPEMKAPLRLGREFTPRPSPTRNLLRLATVFGRKRAVSAEPPGPARLSPAPPAPRTHAAPSSTPAWLRRR